MYLLLFQRILYELKRRQGDEKINYMSIPSLAIHDEVPSTHLLMFFSCIIFAYGTFSLMNYSNLSRNKKKSYKYYDILVRDVHERRSVNLRLLINSHADFVLET